MKTSTFLTLAVSQTLMLTLMLGCEVPEIDVAESTASVSKEKSATELQAEKSKEGYLPDGRLDMSGVVDEPPMTTSTPREVTAKDPKQGKLTRRSGGVLGTSLKALPWAKNKMTFLVIKSELEKYNAIKGDYPKSHEEFMEKYIPEFCPQVLPLPELETGDEYIYDPEDHLLKVYRPES